MTLVGAQRSRCLGAKCRFNSEGNVAACSWKRVFRTWRERPEWWCPEVRRWVRDQDPLSWFLQAIGGRVFREVDVLVPSDDSALKGNFATCLRSRFCAVSGNGQSGGCVWSHQAETLGRSKATETTFLGASEVTKAVTLGRLKATETTFLGASEVTKAATLGRLKPPRPHSWVRLKSPRLKFWADWRPPRPHSWVRLKSPRLQPWVD